MAIRKRNDFILSILSFAIGLFLFASESTVSGVISGGTPHLYSRHRYSADGIQHPSVSQINQSEG